VKKLLQLVKPEWRWLISAITFLTIAAITTAMLPRYISASIAAVIKTEQIQSNDNSALVDSIKQLMIYALLASYASGCRGASFKMIGANVDRRLRLMLFDRLLEQEVGFFDVTKTGELTSRMTQDVAKVTDQVQMNINIFTRTIFQVLFHSFLF
jgi:ABC-type multidrug transport system fused ATPase/permease subunit